MFFCTLKSCLRGLRARCYAFHCSVSRTFIVHAFRARKDMHQTVYICESQVCVDSTVRLTHKRYTRRTRANVWQLALYIRNAQTVHLLHRTRKKSLKPPRYHSICIFKKLQSRQEPVHLRSEQIISKHIACRTVFYTICEATYSKKKGKCKKKRKRQGRV